MGSIVARVKALGLPLEEVIVIGSGLLDAYGLRDAHDVDLVVSKELFEQLKQADRFEKEIRHNDEVLLGDDLEIWLDWGASFEDLMQQAVTVDGVRFAAPETIIEHKQQRGSEKDLNDIRLLREYMNER